MVKSSLPQEVIKMLASSQEREHHATWHYLRERWYTLNREERKVFIDQNWEPPRLNPRQRRGERPAPPRDAGSGLDFFFMHRRMIEKVNSLLTEINDPSYLKVEGWSVIPWSHNDTDWPMPPNYPNGPARAKDPDETARWQSEVQQKHENDAWLRTVSLDDFGAEVENGIHNWLHMHWAAEPWYKGQVDQDENDPRNDYLGSTYSSHVNEIFWKLHGWIDDRVRQWESATGKMADFSNSWDGPTHHMIRKDAPLLNSEQRNQARNFF